MSIFAFKKDGVVNIRVCGYLTRDAKAFDKTVLFSVCYGKDRYMDVKVWRSNRKLSDFAECLEKHDNVAVDGVFEEYTGKDGAKRSQVVADFISVQQEAPEIDEGDSEAGGFTPASGPVDVSADGFDDEGGGELPWN